MIGLESGWASINDYILNKGQFNPGENWLLRGGQFDGRSTFGTACMVGMALRGNGFTYKHAGVKPTLLIVNLLSERSVIIGQMYREATYYCDLTVGSLSTMVEQEAWLEAKFLELGFRYELRCGLSTFTEEDYVALKAELAVDNKRVVAALLDHMPFGGDSTVALNAFFDEGTDIIQIMSGAPATFSTDPRLTGYVDVSIIGGNIQLYTEKAGLSNTLAIPVNPSLSQGWLRDTDNPVLIENKTA